MMDYLQPCCIGTGKASSWSCKVQRLHPLSHSQSDTRSFHRLQHRVTQKCIDNNQGSRSDADSKPLEVFLVKENDKGELLPSDERSENGRWVEKYLLHGFWVTSCMMAGTRKALADEWYPRRHQQKRLQMKSTLEKWILQVCLEWSRCVIISPEYYQKVVTNEVCACLACRMIRAGK